ncbi:MAG: endonuclease [Pseudomonadota bacterium]
MRPFRLIALPISSLTFLVFSSLLMAAAPSVDCPTQWQKIQQEAPVPTKYTSLIGLCQNPLKEKLRALISTNRSNSYNWARQKMMTIIDLYDGKLCGVYGGDCLQTNGRMPDDKEMNCEHTWPQSQGATGIAKSDLHHLFPATPGSNTRRSNYPFCEVAKVSWSADGARLGKNLKGVQCFEAPPAHQGNAARAIFYFAIRYNKTVDPDQEAVLKNCSQKDPVSDQEIRRNDQVESWQNNRNPFVDIPGLEALISDF